MIEMLSLLVLVLLACSACVLTQSHDIHPIATSNEAKQIFPTVGSQKFNGVDLNSQPQVLADSAIPVFIVALISTVTGTDAQIISTFSDNGYVYLGLYPRGTVPPSVNDVLVQNQLFSIVNQSATISLSNLIPATAYSVYFLTKSVSGSFMSYTDLLTTGQDLDSACCKNIKVSMSTQNIQEGKNYLNLISFSSVYAVSSPLTLTPIFAKLFPDGVALPDVSSLISPISATISTGSIVSFSILSTLPASQYSIQFALNGADQANYALDTQSLVTVGDSLLFLNVTSKNAPLPAPVFTSAIFSNDGASLILSFDSSTNRGGTLVSFVCNQLFDFSCSAASKCQWSDDSKTVVASLKGGDVCAAPGDSISLAQGNSVAALCPTGNCRKSQPVTLTIQGPSAAVTPVISLGLPLVLGSGSPLLFDISCSTGNGGRSWKSWTITTSAAVDTKAFTNWFTSSFTISPPSAIPSSYFVPGESYTFLVTLCNFLGKCSQASQQISVLKALIPTVTIGGANIRSVNVFQPLSLASTAYVAQPDGSQITIGISYDWKVFSSGVLANIASVSKDPSKFLLPAYSLDVNNIYVVQVNATYGGQSSLTSTTVNTVPGSVVAVIDGGQNRAVRIGSSSIISGGKSYDQDIDKLFGIDAGLSYQWTCMQLSPLIVQNCGGILTLQSAAESVTVTPTPSATAGSVAQVTLIVTDNSGKRSSTTSVSITLLPTLAAGISLTSNAVQNIINPDQSLIVSAAVAIPADYSTTLSWTTDSGLTGLDLESVALTPLTGVYPSSTQPVSVNLKLPPNSLVGGTSYTFTLTSNLPAPGSASSLSLTVMVNSPPNVGVFTISPDNGVELSTSFTFSCFQWYDDNMPLQYQFSYVSSSGNPVTIRSPKETTFAAAQLPAGDASNDFELVVIAQVFDFYMANSSTTSVVTVQPSASLSDSNVVQGFIQQNQASLLSTNVDAIKQAVGMNNYLLNKAQCASTDDSCKQSASQQREQLVHGILTVSSLEEVSTQSVSDWISSLSVATQNQKQVSANGGNLALTAVNVIVQSVNQSGLEPSVMYSTFNLLSNIAAPVATAGRRRLDSSSSGGVEALQQSLVHYTNVISSSMINDEQPVQQVTTNMKATMQAISGQCTGANTIALPQNRGERSKKTPMSSVSLPCSSGADSIQVGVSSIAASLYGRSDFESDPMSLVLSQPPCADENNCVITISLKRNPSTSATYLPGASFTTQCYQGEKVDHYYDCEGVKYTVSCTGQRSELIQSSCPNTTYVPSCHLLEQQGATSNESCIMLSYDSQTVTCECSLTHVLQRRRMLTGSNSSSSSSSHINVNYVSMLGDVKGNFENTVLSAGSLSGAKVARGWQALVVIGLLIGAILCAMYYSYRADNEAKKIEAIEAKKMQTRLLTGRSFMKSSLNLGSARKSNDVVPATGEEVPAEANAEENVLQLAEMALPGILSSRPYYQKVKEELKRHHRWFGIIYHYSEKFPRILRVLSLATNVIIMLFIQSLTYALTKGDDGSCVHYHSEASCVAPKSSYATGASKCYWTASSVDPTSGRCAFVQPNSSVEVILFVAVFSGIVSTPLAILADWIIIHILAAPDLQPQQGQKAAKIADANSLPAPSSNSQAVVATDSEAAVSESGSEKKKKFSVVLQWNKLQTALGLKAAVHESVVQQLIEQEFKSLTREIQAYRLRLENPHDRKEFDDMWGLDSDGSFKTADNNMNSWVWYQMMYLFGEHQGHVSVSDVITNELSTIHHDLRKEKHLFFMFMRGDRERNKRLLYLFQKDLLPGIQGLILESKHSRDEINPEGSSPQAKLLGWLYLAATNIGMLFYIFLFAVGQEPHRQEAWGQSFALWLVVEIGIIGVLMVLVMHIWIPAWTMKDVQSIQKKLSEAVSSYQQKLLHDREQQYAAAGAGEGEQEGKEEEKKQPEVGRGGRRGIKRGSMIGRLLNRAPVGEESDDEAEIVEAKEGGEVTKKWRPFNATRYLFLSHRISKLYSDLTVAKIILDFSSPWPKQSYQYVTNISSSYEQSSSGLSRASSIILLFFVSSFLTMPVSLQDMLLQAISTAASGYAVLVHYQLYRISPVLIVVPVAFLGIVLSIRQILKRRREERDRLRKKAEALRAAAGGDTGKDKDKESTAKDEGEELPEAQEVLPVPSKSFVPSKSDDLRPAAAAAVVVPAVGRKSVAQTAHVTRRASVAQGIQTAQLLHTMVSAADQKAGPGSSQADSIELVDLARVEAEAQSALAPSQLVLCEEDEDDDASSGSFRMGDDDDDEDAPLHQPPSARL